MLKEKVKMLAFFIDSLEYIYWIMKSLIVNKASQFKTLGGI